MKDNYWRTIGSRGLSWVLLLKGNKDFILGELLYQLPVHFISNSRWYCCCYIIKTSWLGRCIDIPEVLDSNISNSIICIIPSSIIILESQYSILPLLLWCPKVENFCVAIPLLKPLNSWSLVLVNLFTIKKVINILPQNINFGPMTAIRISEDEWLEGCPFFLYLFRYATKDWMTPAWWVRCTFPKAKDKTLGGACVKAGIPSILNNFFELFFVCPHHLKMKTTLLWRLDHHLIRDKQGAMIRGGVNEVVDSCVLEVASLVICC